MYPLIARLLGSTAASRQLAASGGTDGISARYWRVFILTNNGNTSYTTLSRVEMYSSALNGGARVDRCTGGTPIFSTQGGFGGAETATLAFDDLNNKIWATASGDANRLNCWIGYDFGSPIAIDRFALQGRGSFQDMMPQNFRLEYSTDNVTWTTLFTPAAQTAWATNEMRLFTAPSYFQAYTGSPHGAHRYWRIHCASSSDNASTYSVAEVEFRATPDGADQATGGTASAHSEYAPPTYNAAKAFDNDPYTLWSADGTSTNGWLQYDFGAGNAVSVAQVQITARSGTDWGQTPRYGQIEFSDDGSNWSVAWEFALNAFTSGSIQVTTDPAYVASNARYWRVLVLENGSFPSKSTGAISIENLEMRATPGGADLTGDATSAISSTEFGAGYINDYAFDGSPSTYFVSENANYGTNWIGYDFGLGNAVDIQQIVWSKRPDGFGVNEAPFLGVVQSSFDKNIWVSKWSFLNTVAWTGGVETKTFTKPTGTGHMFWRVRATAIQGGTNYPFSVSRLELKTTVGGSNIATGGLPDALNALGGYPATNAFDANSSTFWISATYLNTSAPWLGYYFTSPVEVNEITIQLRSDSFGGPEAITAGVVESSDDRLTWTTEWLIGTRNNYVNNSTEVRRFTRPGQSATNWRLAVDKTAYLEQQGFTSCQIAEIEMRETAGGADQCSGGTASTSNGGTPANAFDNNVGTNWRGESSPSFIQYAMASSKSIVELAITVPDSVFCGDFPTVMRVQTNDASSVSEIRQLKTGPWGPGETRVFNILTHVDEPKKFIRLRPTGLQNAGFQFGCQELEFRTSSGGANIATGGVAFSYEYDGANPPANAFDGSPTTRWYHRTGGATGIPYLGYHLSSAIADMVTQISYTAPNITNGGNYCPTGFHVEYGIGNVWTNIWTVSGIGTWTQGETKIFTKP